MSDKTSYKTSDKRLLPCPFCGGEAEFHRTNIKTNGGWTDSVVVCCKVCEARTNRVIYNAKNHQNDAEYDEVAKAWNTRKPMDDIVERLEAQSTRPCLVRAERNGYARAIEIVKEVINK